MQNDRTTPVEDTDQDQMDTLEDDILSDQMETSDDDMQSWSIKQNKSVIRFRCVSQGIKKIGGTHEGKVKRHQVTSATVARVCINDERAGPDSHVGR
jgi:Co/Zn/Cd efflux system component